MMALALALLVALAVDRCFGEPRVRLHPVVWMGNYLGRAGAWVQRRAQQSPQQPDFKAFWLAALVWCAGAAIVLGVTSSLQAALGSLPWWAAGVLLGLLLKPLLAWTMLKSEVLAVESALAESLEAGRERLSWLVSRDVSALSEAQVRESAIESLAENLNDSVVAPIFWFVLLGLPGAALYRFANTADAMWGYKGVYKGQNWEWAGKWAARADDVLSWLPARLTGWLLWWVSLAVWPVRSDTNAHLAVTPSPTEGRLGRVPRVNTRQLRHEALKTSSPNSGWPMAAMALALGVRLGKPGAYVLNPAGRQPSARDITLAIKYASKMHVALIFIALLAMYFIFIFGV